MQRERERERHDCPPNKFCFYISLIMHFNKNKKNNGIMIFQEVVKTPVSIIVLFRIWQILFFATNSVCIIFNCVRMTAMPSKILSINLLNIQLFNWWGTLPMRLLRGQDQCLVQTVDTRNDLHINGPHRPTGQQLGSTAFFASTIKGHLT